MLTSEDVGWSAWMKKELTVSLDEILRQRVAKFGEVPEASVYDKSVKCVKDYLKSVAKDPDSLKFEQWSDIRYNDNDGWIVLCKYRAKIALAAMNAMPNGL